MRWRSTRRGADWKAVGSRTKSSSAGQNKDEFQRTCEADALGRQKGKGFTAREAQVEGLKEPGGCAALPGFPFACAFHVQLWSMP